MICFVVTILSKSAEIQVSAIVSCLLGPERAEKIQIYAGDVVPRKKPDPVNISSLKYLFNASGVWRQIPICSETKKQKETSLGDRVSSSSLSENLKIYVPLAFSILLLLSEVY